jgi:hypothetical protein
VPEVNARFEQLLHDDVRQVTSSIELHPGFWSGIHFPSPALPLRTREEFICKSNGYQHPTANHRSAFAADD